MGFVSADFEGRLLNGDVLELDASELANPETGLEQDLDNGIHADIAFGGVAKRPILEGREDAGRGNLVFGVGNAGCRASRDCASTDQVFKKRFDGVQFARNTLEGVLFIFEILFESLEVVASDPASFGYSMGCEEGDQLVQIFSVRQNGRGGAAVLL